MEGFSNFSKATQLIWFGTGYEPQQNDSRTGAPNHQVWRVGENFLKDVIWRAAWVMIRIFKVNEG